MKMSLAASIRRCAPVFILLVFVLLSGCSSKRKNLDAGSSPDEIFRRAQSYYQVMRYEESEELLKMLMEDYPYSEFALDAQLLIADLYFRQEKYEDASSYYGSFVTLHPGHQKAPYSLFQQGMSHFKEVLSVDRDQKATRKSLFAFEDLRVAYPNSPYSEKSMEMIRFLRERLAGSEFYIGNYYFKDKNYKAALARFGEILENYPDCSLADKTLYYIIMSYEKLGEDERAKEAYGTLVSEYPDSPFCEEVKYELDG